MKSAHRTPPAYRWLDDASGWLTMFLVVWAPWAFGCTDGWSIRPLIAGCNVLGALWLAKAFLRWRLGYIPERWVHPTPAGRWALRALAVLSLLFLAWAFIGAANGRGYLEITPLGPILHEYPREPIAWLPSSHDALMSWRAAWRWTAYCLAFWSVRDWLIGKSRRERHEAGDHPFPTDRIRKLLWTLAISSSLLALTGILQRLDGTTKLLWLLQPALNDRTETQFGSYAYRGNAAQYFNLVWPAVLGFWWALHAQAKALNPRSKVGNEPSVLLLPAVVLLMAVPIVATTRGGALVLVGLAGALVVVAGIQRGVSRRLRLALGTTLVVALALGWLLGGEAQKKRFTTIFDDQMSGRTEIYRTAHHMAREFGLLGSGAESFTGLNYLYREKLEERWQGYAHDDWLETYVTLGGVGLALAILLLLALTVGSLTSAGVRVPPFFPLTVGLGMAGILIHAKLDFPFQVESLRFTFLVMAALLLASPCRRSHG